MIRSATLALCATLALADLAKAATLPDPVVKALDRALEDERSAETVYAAVIEKLGAVRPFANIIRAEHKHAALIRETMEAYGVAVPKAVASKVAVPATRKEACAAGQQAEIANRELYDNELLPAVKDYPDIVATLTLLRGASEDHHLPVFERCVARGG